MPRDEPGKAFAVVLHDVSPQTWPLYRTFLADLDATGSVPLTLLVVPDFHHSGALTADPAFCAAIEARLERGDEVAMHGYSHSDDRPLGFNPSDFLLRRVYTREGEFQSLTGDEARQRLEQGLEIFAGLGWPVAGFVAPAWLMNSAARTALAGFPFVYTSTNAALIRLPQWQPLRAPSLVWSARSAWRRRASRLWNQRLLQRSRERPLVRLGLHPVDMRYPEVRRFWNDAIEQLSTERAAVTKRQWLAAAA